MSVNQLHYNGTPIPFQLKKSDRKTVGIRVTDTGIVEISAPRHLPSETLMDVLKQRARWIYEKRNQVLSETFEEPFPLILGQQIPFRGRSIGLNIEVKSDIVRCSARLKDDVLRLTVSESTRETLVPLLEAWFRDRAKSAFMERIAYYAPIVGVRVGRISVKDQKTRWGSCSSKSNLNFNWRLLLAPEDVLDYVVVHELCHLVHLNHSAAFWEMVEHVMPEYESRRRWLKAQGTVLMKWPQ